MSGCHDWELDLWLRHSRLANREGDREQISEGWTNTILFGQMLFSIWRNTFWDLERYSFFEIWTSTFLSYMMILLWLRMRTEALASWLPHKEWETERRSVKGGSWQSLKMAQPAPAWQYHSTTIAWCQCNFFLVTEEQQQEELQILGS